MELMKLNREISKNTEFKNNEVKRKSEHSENIK